MVFGIRKNKKIKIKDDFNLNWYGHRGLLKRAPENTWLGFQAALDAGFCSIEMDVLQTVYGNGCDSSGSYIINGSHDPSSGQITFRKRYKCNPCSTTTFWGNLAGGGSSACGIYTSQGGLEFGAFKLSLST